MEREVVNDFDTMDTINFFHTLIFGPLSVVETEGCRVCPNGVGVREGGENSLSDSSYFILYVQVPLGIFTFILPTSL